MKRIAILVAALMAASGALAQLPAEQHLDKTALRPRYRQWMQPVGGVVVTQNPPSLLWPAGGEGVTGYRVELSPSPEFPAERTLVSRQPWAV